MTVWFDRIIRWGFFALFFFVPLALTPWNYELFEYNKMVVTYALTAIIVSTWFLKMIQKREISFVRTPLDIPLFLFIGSQLVSSVFSIDPHVSWMGYYSRFNGGMWSVFCYALLYWAFVNNVGNNTQENSDYKLLPFIKTFVASACVVAIYGVLERLGIDKHLWVQDVQSRVFSTLGQPNWLAAYLVGLLPITIALYVTRLRLTANSRLPIRFTFGGVVYLALSFLFFITLIFTRSRSGLLGFAAADAVLWLGLLASRVPKKATLAAAGVLHVLLFLFIFVNGSYVEQIDRYMSYPRIKERFASKTASVAPNIASASAKPIQTSTLLEYGGTESGKIRAFVWEGALAAWKSSKKAMLIGTGTETFAFAFFRYRPVGHNLTSEWDFLYNKAHNEYLNYLATTGAFGLGSYLLLLSTCIIWFVMAFGKLKASYRHEHTHDVADLEQFQKFILTLAVFSGWISVLITNFFGFSVVITQLFLFLFPAFMFTGFIKGHATSRLHGTIPAALTIPLSIAAFLIGTVTVGKVILYWVADLQFANGYRLVRSDQAQAADTYLTSAILLNRTEPVYYDEWANDLGLVSIAAAEKRDASVTAELVKKSIGASDVAISISPQNVNFWKTRTKLFYSFSSFNPEFNTYAVEALEKALELSPLDPKILYNLAILKDRETKRDEAIDILKKTIEIKPNYRDAYVALTVFYTDSGKPLLAKQILTTYLTAVDPEDKDIQERLKQ